MKIVTLFALSLFMAISLDTSFASAEGACPEDNGLPSFDSAISLPRGISTVYARLNLAGKQSNAQIYLNSVDSASCVLIGSEKLDAVNWQRIGIIDTFDPMSLTVLQIRLDDPGATQGASSPSVLIVPTTSAPCPDPNNCIVPFLGNNYVLSPRKISLNSDTLRVAQYDAVDDKTGIKKTIYYSGNDILYSVEGKGGEIDKRYIGAGEHILKTNLITAAGQVLTKTEVVDNPLSMQGVVYPLLLKNSSTLRAIGLIIGVFVVYAFGVATLRKFVVYRRWKKTHIASGAPAKQGLAEPTLSSTDMYAVLQKKNSVKKDIKLISGSVIAPAITVTLLLISSIFVVGTFKVDGVSMETTLHDRSTQWIYKLPVTMARFNNGNVSLERGDVVVLNHDDNNLFLAEAEIEKSFVVKRVIGLPGERIRVANGEITVFNKNSPEGVNPDRGASWESVVAPSNGLLIDIIIKEGELFVVGDGRDYSVDSRYYGPVKSTDVVGVVLYGHGHGLAPYSE